MAWLSTILTKCFLIEGSVHVQVGRQGRISIKLKQNFVKRIMDSLDCAFTSPLFPENHVIYRKAIILGQLSKKC